MYQSTKTFGHELGLSCCFRQWKASSHCRLLHGYALSFKFVFQALDLDDRNWVQDFGGLKTLKQQIMDAFDHKLVVSEDDPLLPLFRDLSSNGGAQLTIMSAVGCEAFARAGFELAEQLYTTHRVIVVSCEVREHGANSAIYINPNLG